jgi:hypothetical protein
MKLKTEVAGYGHITVKLREDDLIFADLVMVGGDDLAKKSKTVFILNKNEMNNLITALNATWRLMEE